MKLERFKEKRKINKVIITVLILLLITGGYFLSQTFSKYTYETDKIPFINGKVKYSASGNGDITFAFYQGDKSVTTMPSKSSGYIYDVSRSNCDKGANIKWNEGEWGPLITNLNETKTTCTLYFVIPKTTGNALADKILLADQPSVSDVGDAIEKIIAKGKPDFHKDATTDMGMYMTEDDLGASYYYRGAVQDNWVKFANLYWRIIRINGDGTVRMIYNGTSTAQTGSGTQVTTQKFNNSYNNPMYVGYMYGTFDKVTGTYQNTNNSIIKTYLENTWFDSKLKNYTNYLADEIFCNDRSIKKGDGISADNYTQYFAGDRIISSSPILTCPQANDRFAKGQSVGSIETNGKLTKPVGLITADEAMMGGVSYIGSAGSYLNTEQEYWTMTSYEYSRWLDGPYYAYIAYIESPDSVGGESPDLTLGVRPVINLNSNISVTGGNGSSASPYLINGGN